MGWLAIAGLTTLVAFALTWVAVALGLTSRNPESASNAALPMQFLPFLGTAFVPVDSMPTVLRWFATYKPFTPMVESLRDLLAGTPPGIHAVIAVAWCPAIAVAGYGWARSAFRRAALR